LLFRSGLLKRTDRKRKKEKKEERT